MEKKEYKEEIELFPTILSRIGESTMLKVMIVICIITLLACAYTLETAGAYKNKCNEHWEQQIERLDCITTPQPFKTNITYPWITT